MYRFLILFAWLLAVEVSAATPVIPPAPTIAGSSYLLIDADTDRDLVEHNANLPLPPASLTKIMTSYVAGHELASGRVSLDDMVHVSVKAWRMGGSKMFIREGTQVRFEDLLRGVIIQSGNDASVAIAEHIAGSEDAFADMMNHHAVELGMVNTTFLNATGWPAEGHATSAWDLSRLTKALIQKHPEMYALYAERSFKYGDIDQSNRNRLLWRDQTVDGVKTGHTEAAGYCLVASAERDGMRLISVVMGTESDEARMVESQKLLSYGFRYFETRQLYDAGVALKQAELFYGENDEVELGLAESAVVTFPRGHYDDLKAELETPSIVEAPLSQGDEVGELVLKLAGETIYRAPLVALVDEPESGFFSSASDFVYLFFRELLE